MCSLRSNCACVCVCFQNVMSVCRCASRGGSNALIWIIFQVWSRWRGGQQSDVCNENHRYQTHDNAFLHTDGSCDVMWWWFIHIIHDMDSNINVWGTLHVICIVCILVPLCVCIKGSMYWWLLCKTRFGVQLEFCDFHCWLFRILSNLDLREFTEGALFYFVVIF